MKLITVYNPEYYTSQGVDINHIQKLISEAFPIYVVRHIDAINMINGLCDGVNYKNIIGVIKKIRFEFGVFLIKIELVSNSDEKIYYDALKSRETFGVFPFFSGELGDDYCRLKSLKCFVFKIRSEK